MTTARNDITGDLISSKKGSDNYRDGWDRIFGKKQHNHDWVDCEPQCDIDQTLTDELNDSNQ